MAIPDGNMLLAKKYAIAWSNLFGDIVTEDDIVHINNTIAYLRQHPHIQFMLKLLIIEDSIKEEALHMLKKVYSLPEGYDQLCELLIAHRRTFLLESILHTIVQLYWERKHIAWFTVTSAIPLSARQQAECRTFLESQCKMEVRCTYEHVPSLIAGIRMQSDHAVWEHSIKGQMRMIHQLLG